DRRRTDATELHLADLDVVPGLTRLLLGEAHRRHLWVAEGRARDEPVIEWLHLGAGDRLGGDDSLLGRLVSERGPVDEVADRVDLRVGGALALIDDDATVLAELDPGAAEPERGGVGRASACNGH